MLDSIKTFIGRSRLLFVLRVFAEKNSEACYLLTRLSSGQSNWRKLEPSLRIETHALEKGMSIGAVRAGFGKDKTRSLIKGLRRYIAIGGRKPFVNESCSIISKYIEFNKGLGADMNDVEAAFTVFCEEFGISTFDYGGIRLVQKSEVKAGASSSFDSFSQYRFAVRDFGTTPIDIEKIQLALQLAERTPSACNRQSWKVHVFASENERKTILSMQGGSKGFSEDIQYAILITGNLNSYRFYELNQVFVDCGLYAMNLMYALNFYGVATIPLTMSMKMSKLKRIVRSLHLPYSEIPAILIGAGSYKDSFKVAKSERLPYSDYTSVV